MRLRPQAQESHFSALTRAGWVPFPSAGSTPASAGNDNVFLAERLSPYIVPPETSMTDPVVKLEAGLAR